MYIQRSNSIVIREKLNPMPVDRTQYYRVYRYEYKPNGDMIRTNDAASGYTLFPFELYKSDTVYLEKAQGFTDEVVNTTSSSATVWINLYETEALYENPVDFINYVFSKSTDMKADLSIIDVEKFKRRKNESHDDIKSDTEYDPAVNDQYVNPKTSST